MSRTKSELLSSMGSGFEILKAITDEVISQGGSDEDVRRILKDQKVKDEKVRKQIDDIPVSEQKFFTFIVDFDDSRWKKFPFEGNYVYVNENLKGEHFPIRHKGKCEVTVELVRYNAGKTFAEHLSICNEQNAPEGDRAIAETFYEQFPGERKKGLILAPCGSQFERGGDRGVTLVSADDDGVELDIDWVGDRWDQGLRFLVPREIKPLDV